MVLDKSIEALEDLVRFLNRKQSFYFKLYDRYLEGDHNRLDDSRKHEADCNAVCDDIVECIKAISDEAQIRGVAKKPKVLCTLDGQDEEKYILDEWLLKVVRLLDSESNWNRMLAPVEGKDMNNAFDAILFRLTYVANFLKELSTKTEQEYYGGRRTDAMPYYIGESKERRKPLKEMTQAEFNRLARRRDEFRVQTDISPAEKNNLYADIKDFEEEFKDLQDTAERLPDSYIDQVCSTSSYPFDVAIDEVQNVEDWCSEAEEFLKDDINSWGNMRESDKTYKAKAGKKWLKGDKLVKSKLKETSTILLLTSHHHTDLPNSTPVRDGCSKCGDRSPDKVLQALKYWCDDFNIEDISGPEDNERICVDCFKKICKDRGVRLGKKHWWMRPFQESDKTYKAKASGKWLSGNKLVKDADTFESKTEPTQRLNQMKKDGKLNKDVKIDVVEESIFDFEAQNQPMYRFAKRKHDATGAIRKHSGDPYWVHPEGVAKIAAAYGGTDIEIQAAMAHDTLEDTNCSYEELEEMFGDEVASIVREITNDTEEVDRLGKEQYINLELINLSHPALFVKLCDMYYNQMDFPTEAQKRRMIKNINYLLANREDDLNENEIALIEDILQTLIY